MTSGSTEGMPKVLKQLFHNRGRLLMRSIWNSDRIFSIFFCCERQDDGTVEKGLNRVFIRMPLNCSINAAFSDAPIASTSLVPLSLTVFPRVGSRNRCSRLKTLCKASLTLTSDITAKRALAAAVPVLNPYLKSCMNPHPEVPEGIARTGKLTCFQSRYGLLISMPLEIWSI